MRIHFTSQDDAGRLWVIATSDDRIRIFHRTRFGGGNFRYFFAPGEQVNALEQAMALSKREGIDAPRRASQFATRNRLAIQLAAGGPSAAIVVTGGGLLAC